MAQLLKIMLATSANTSPVERGYSIPQICTSKRRNRINPLNLEIFFLLASLKIPLNNPDDYKKERKRLDGKSRILQTVFSNTFLY